MAVKLQDMCYRTIKGERYVNWCDLIAIELEDEVRKVKQYGFPHRIYKHPDGFRRLFIREVDLEALAAAA
jgi:hypothetical protein